MDDVKTYLNSAEEKMAMAIEFLDEALAHIRAGKANPRILDGIRVDYYGSLAPLSNVANISVPDARTIVITPWEKSMFKVIEKAILDSELGITPENNGEIIRLSIPPLTEERRKALVKQSKQEAENAKVSVRNARRCHRRAEKGSKRGNARRCRQRRRNLGTKTSRQIHEENRRYVCRKRERDTHRIKQKIKYIQKGFHYRKALSFFSIQKFLLFLRFSRNSVG